MENLLELLTQYAEEELVLRYLREYTPQIRAARLREEKLEESLTAMAPEVQDYVEKLKIELDTISSCREQALLLSGISIGIKLGRL